MRPAQLFVALAAVVLSMLLCCRSPHSQWPVSEVNLPLYDSARQRSVPVQLFLPSPLPPRPRLLLFSHGYGANNTSQYLKYRFLCRTMAAQGYAVASVQHEQPGDELLPGGDHVFEARLPNRDRGCDNLLFVINTLHARYPAFRTDTVTLAGHSNGGDISLWFAGKYPQRVAKVISLDSRRVPLLRAPWPRQYTLRSCDQLPDSGAIGSALAG